MAHRTEERRLGFVRGLGAPLEDQGQVVYLSAVERKRSTSREIFSKLDILRAVRRGALGTDECDGSEQSVPGNQRYRQ